MQLFFAAAAFSLIRIGQFSVVWIEGDNKFFWFAQVLLLFHVERNKLKSDVEQFAIHRYFEITQLLGKVE